MRKSAYLIMKLLFIVGLFMIFFSYAMFQGGFVSWFLFYMIIPFLVYYLMFIFYPIKDWTVKRVLLEKTTKAGQGPRVQLELTRKIPFPLSYLIVEEFLPKSIEPIFENDHWEKGFRRWSLNRREPIQIAILYPNFKRRQLYRYQIEQVPRGIHTFRSVRLTVTDLFGFLTKSVTLPIESTLKVVPVDVSVQLKWSNKQKQIGDEIVSSFHTNHSNNVAGAREYVSGDRLSAIHWKATAKSEVLMTKEFDQENSRDGTIMLFGFKEHMTYEWNIAICYTLVQMIKNQHLVVSFDYVGDRSITFSADHDWANLKDVFTAFKPGANQAKIETVFKEYQRSFVIGQFLLLFTDQLTNTVVERLLNLSRESHSQITVYVAKSHFEDTKEAQILEEKLRNHSIDVYPITEQDVKDARGVVTI